MHDACIDRCEPFLTDPARSQLCSAMAASSNVPSDAQPEPRLTIIDAFVRAVSCPHVGVMRSYVRLELPLEHGRGPTSSSSRPHRAPRASWFNRRPTHGWRRTNVDDSTCTLQVIRLERTLCHNARRNDVRAKDV